MPVAHRASEMRQGQAVRGRPGESVRGATGRPGHQSRAGRRASGPGGSTSPARARRVGNRRATGHAMKWAGWMAAEVLGGVAGAPVAGSDGPGEPASPLFLPGRRCPLPPHGGLAGDGSPALRLGKRPCCVDPSSQPFDWRVGPSGDTPRVTQSPAVRRRIPVAVWRRSNDRFCPACGS